ncbi:TetR/AcrR family transcriptional regulator [Sphingobacteriales bacterium UPWRP_1]|nr:TetR family transcriptional regulator [Sphingobacteriales bacterium TSM_CSS]PSJ74704.1 TetR/AcrR family transcriptional regulator [Sphingobacteriales bacterium UPWRP_1]
MAVVLKMQINPNLYLRDPAETKLGRNIIDHSIRLIDEIGFEEFTFKKLAAVIQSTEASVYRYFENKHKLLVYIVSWYWEWVKYKIDVQTLNLHNPQDKLRVVINVLIESSVEDPATPYINETLLHRIVVSEATKTYHIKQVDAENKEGFFLPYKSLCNKIARIISEIRPGFPYPHALASNLVEMANHHIYFARHLPSLTDVRVSDTDYSQVQNLLTFFSFGLLQHQQPGS